MAPDTVGPEPQPGDLIEISCGVYEHWTIYVGDGYVVHLTGIDTETPGLESGVAAPSVPDTQAMVKKELLSKVATGCKYQVNNKHDGQRRVRSSEQIVHMALAWVGHECSYSLTQENCEHFAMEQRYGEPISDPDRIRPEPQPGDLIEISCGVYGHWSIYVGDGYVVHLTGIDTVTPGLESGVAAPSVQGTRAMVKKELLSKVATGCKYQVNNKHDGQRRVRSSEQIVHMALAWVGQECSYSLTQENCEHFALEQRYGESISDQTRFDPEPQPGDLIEFFHCNKFGIPWLQFHHHWAVYVGNGYVVHLINQGGGISGLFLRSQGVVKKELLVQVAWGCEYRVNNKYDEKFPVLPSAEIVQNALALLGQKKFYCVFLYNCEHFAMKLRYGVAHSDQVKKFCKSPSSKDCSVV